MVRKLQICSVPHLVALLTMGLAFLGGCRSLSTGASMRVDVEVYKGPLSKELAAQIGELCGVLGELQDSVQLFHEGLYAATATLPGHAGKPIADLLMQSQSCDAEDERGRMSIHPVQTPGPIAQCWCEPVRKAGTIFEQSACLTLAQIHGELHNLQAVITPILTTPALCKADFEEKKEKPGLLFIDAKAKSRLEDISNLAFRLKTKAVYRAESDTMFLSYNRIVRAVSAGFANLGAEYGNLLGSRADALLKQTEHVARVLPTSVYLRDSQATDFVNMYVWDRAVMPALLQDFILHPVDSFSSDGATSRVRGLERFFADTYWSNINTVHAAGQGDVSMALIKDDIGNWNLKSFSGDPSELLKAYKEGGLALVKEAAKVALSPAADIGKAQRMLEFANSLSLGTAQPVDGKVGADQVARLHDRARNQLVELRNTQQPLFDATDDPDKRTQILDKTKAESRKILQEYESLLQALADTAATAAKPESDKPDAETLSKGLKKRIQK